MSLKDYFPVRTAPKLAIVGMYGGTRDQAPWDDESYDIWCLNEAYYKDTWVKRYTMWWQMHDNGVIFQNINDKDHAAWLANCGAPVMMMETHESIPNSVAFPIDEVIQEFGTKYISSSFAFMVIAAWAMEYERVEAFGFKMSNDGEYFKQRPNADYWLGRLMEREPKMRVYMPEDTEILRGDFYAYETTHQSILSAIDKRRTGLTVEKEIWNNKSSYYEGQARLLQKFAKAGIEYPKEMHEAVALDWETAKKNYNRYAGAIIEDDSLHKSMLVYGSHRG